MSGNVTFTVQGGVINITPYFLANMSRDFHVASAGFRRSERFPVIKFYLYCVSIELGLKAAILSYGNTPSAKARIKSIGHDLIKAHTEYAQLAGRPLFNAADLASIAKVNPLFKAKAMEYATPELLVAMLRGFTTFPPLAQIRKASMKVRKLLAANDEYLNV